MTLQPRKEYKQNLGTSVPAATPLTAATPPEVEVTFKYKTHSTRQSHLDIDIGISNKHQIRNTLVTFLSSTRQTTVAVHKQV
jgi:hypothetical protein